MSLEDDKTYKMKMRDVEAAFKYRRIPYPKRTIEIVALIAISCTFLLYLHTNKLTNRLKDMEVRLQPSALTSLGLTGTANDHAIHQEGVSLQKTYEELKKSGQHHHKHHQNHHDNKMKHLDTDDDDDDELLKRRHHSRRHKSKSHPQKKIVKDIKHFDTEDEPDNDNDDDNENDNDNDLNNSTEGGENDKDDDLEKEDEADSHFIANKLQAALLNNTRKAEIDVVFFNRVPKVGSQSLMELMRRLGAVNGFTHARDPPKPHETIFLDKTRQKELIDDLLTRKMPHAFSQHIAYINFTRYHMPKPIYINMIRDPIERIISWHYYFRAEWYYRDLKDKLGDKAPATPPKYVMNMDLDTCVRTHDIYCQFNQMEIINKIGDHRRQTLFFCGQNKQFCMPFNSRAAMQKAKRTVEEDYAVVGTWEDTNITLSVLEYYIPKFFKNAKVAYYLGKEKLSKINKNAVKRPVSEKTRQILRQNFTHEIEFYEFCKQRLYLQYTAITGGRKIDEDDYLLVPEDTDTSDLVY